MIGSKLINTYSGSSNPLPFDYSYVSAKSSAFGFGTYGGQWALFFNSDGSKLFWAYTEYDWHTNRAYSLSSPYDITTASQISSVAVYPNNSYQSTAFWKPDGTKYWQTGYTNACAGGWNGIYEWNAPTQWDYSNPTFSTYTRLGSNCSGNCLNFNGDGTKYMYFTADDSGNNKAYITVNLGTSWTLSNQTSFTSISAYTLIAELNIAGWNHYSSRWSSDGVIFYASLSFHNGSAWTQNKIISFTASTPYDLSTLTRNDVGTELIPNTQNSSIGGMYISPDMSVMALSYFVSYNNGRIEIYQL